MRGLLWCLPRMASYSIKIPYVYMRCLTSVHAQYLYWLSWSSGSPPTWWDDDSSILWPAWFFLVLVIPNLCNYLEPQWPLFLKVNPQKQALFHPKRKVIWAPATCRLQGVSWGEITRATRCWLLDIQPGTSACLLWFGLTRFVRQFWSIVSLCSPKSLSEIPFRYSWASKRETLTQRCQHILFGNSWGTSSSWQLLRVSRLADAQCRRCQLWMRQEV